MKCPDCNGVIEGAQPFCPHCGRKFEGGLTALRRRLPTLPRQEPPTEAFRPSPLASQQQSGHSPPAILPRIILVAASLFAGGVIGYILPGKPWMTGAIIGLFLGLPKKKKS